jgi:hypothetical protein
MTWRGGSGTIFPRSTPQLQLFLCGLGRAFAIEKYDQHVAVIVGWWR